ncbi:MAG: hypothetical protein HY320_12145 [Armatimonadetes bacterium]|nr:hypothetical protein [Armatimonadota bacterium]
MKALDVLKEIGTWGLHREANQAFLLGIAGDPEEADRARQTALGPTPTPEQIGDADPYLLLLYPPFTEQDRLRLARCDIVASVKNGPGITECRPAEVALLSRPEDLVHEVLERKPWLGLALARRLPGFRDTVAERLIQDISRINAEFAILAGIPSAVPWLVPYVPVMTAADWLVLTKNQAFLVLRLAAAYGQAFHPLGRYRELLGVVGGAVGWRALARRVAGMVPGAVGLGIKATVAFTATYITGRAAQHYFRLGRQPDPEEMRTLRQEAELRARSAVAQILARLRARKPEE